MTRLRRWWQGAGKVTLPGLLVVVLIALLQTITIPAISPIIQGVGLQVFDVYQRIHPRPYEAAPVRILDIDDETIRRYGQWPWPRTDMARLTLAMGEAGAAAIAFDIVYSEVDRTSPRALASRYEQSDPAAAKLLRELPDNDAQFAQVLGATPSVMGFFLTSGTKQQQARPKAGLAISGTPPSSAPSFSNAVLPIAQLLEPAAGLGSLSIEPDADSIIRRAPLIARQGDQFLPSLSLEAMRVAFQTNSALIKTTDGSGEGAAAGDVVAVRVGDVEVPTNESGEMWMHYTRPVPERIVPAWMVLSGALSPDVLQKTFEGHIVFIGTSAIGLRDLRSTPVNERELGVMVHAQAAEQMILGKYLNRPDWAIGLERTLILVLGLGLVLLLPRIGAKWGAVLVIVALAALFLGSWYAFVQQRYLLNPTWPALAMIFAYLIGTVLVYYREEKQRAYIHNAFDRYLSPELVRRIADDPSQLELGGEEREMTVMFCDIRSFSRISESLSANAIIRFLIAFLTPMTDILIGRRGTIDKYIGDAILAFWNAPLDDPDQYENAALGALEMVGKLAELNRTMPLQDAEPWPGDVKIGIGLNAGPCCVGNMGSQQRLSYSLIGDTVNLASRIEGLTKYYGVEIAIGSALHEKIPHFATVPLDLVRVVGRDRPEEVHVLLGDQTLAATERFQAFAKGHAEMRAAYMQRQWADADRLRLHWLDEARHFSLGKLYSIYEDRIAAYRERDPGPDWDLVYSATEK